MTGVQTCALPISHTLHAAFAVSVLALVPACNEQPVQEVNYADLGWKAEKFTFAEKPFTGVATEKHKNGNPKNRWEILNGEPHGVVREWYDNGQLMVETHYDHNLRHGLNRYWNKDGSLMKEQVYEQGKSISIKEPAKK